MILDKKRKLKVAFLDSSDGEEETWQKKTRNKWIEVEKNDSSINQYADFIGKEFIDTDEKKRFKIINIFQNEKYGWWNFVFWLRKYHRN